jgi:hypothetical protein
MWPFSKKVSSPSVLPVWLFAGSVFLLKCSYILATSIRSLGSKTWLIDDSYIEMKVARNLGLGHGFSLDGIHPTTGAPFFWISLSSINHMFLELDAAIRTTLMETSLLAALATVVVFFLALKLTEDRRIAWTALLLSTFTANAFFNGMNGMDTALFTLLVLMSVGAYFGVGRPAQLPSLAWGCIVGALLGLTVMTRGDGIFVIFSIVVAGAYEWWVAPSADRKDHRNVLIGILLVSGICFASFMTWQLIQTGSPFPGNQVGRREIALALHHFSFDRFSWPQYLKIVAWNIFQLEDILAIATGGSLLLLTAFVAGCFQKRLRVFALVTGLYLTTFFVLLVTYQWYFMDLHGLRYINVPAHLLFIFLAWFLWQIPIQRYKAVTVSTLIASVIVLAGYKHYQMCSRFEWSKYMSYLGEPDPTQNAYFWSTVDWMRDHLPAGTIVGVRDYGRASLFTNVRVQDIAGNIDPEVVTALKNRTLDQYLKDRNVEYLLIPSLRRNPASASSLASAPARIPSN